MNIDIKLIKRLRESTGCSPAEAKKALTECDSNIEAALALLRKQGVVKGNKQLTKPQLSGRIAIATTKDAIAVVEVLTGTDFTAMTKLVVDRVQEIAGRLARSGKLDTEIIPDLVNRTKENITIERAIYIPASPKAFGTYLHSDARLAVIVGFNKEVDPEFAKDIAMHIAATNPLAISRAGLPKEWIEKETAIAKEAAAKTGKPESIIEKIVAGQVNALIKEKCLVEQQFVKDTKVTIRKLLDDRDLEISEFVRLQVGA